MRKVSCYQCGAEVEVRSGECECAQCGARWVAIMPQAGPQELFLSLKWVDIAVYGGAAGGGKTWALLQDPLDDLSTPGFGAVIFRRESPQITSEGGLWDTSMDVYPHIGGKPLKSPYHQWVFPKCHKNKITFTHLQRETDKLSHQGAQYPWIGWDELTHFTESQFWYLVSRNRSTCGVKPRIRATTNPDASSWVKRLIGPWVDDEYPKKAKPGDVRYLVRIAPEYHWFETRREAVEFAAERHCLSQELAKESVKSVTFIEADIWDNPILMASDPGYLANLLAQDEVERERLLYKNWSIMPDRFFGDWRAKTAEGTPWHMVRTSRIQKGYRYCLGVDWGFSQPFAAYLMGIASDGRVMVCREIYGTKMLTSLQGEKMREMIVKNGLRLEDVPVYAGHDVFNRRLNSQGAYDEPIVLTWQNQGLQCISAGRDPLNRASKFREHLRDWGPDIGWAGGRPGLQVMDCCEHFLRTVPVLKADANNPEMVDTTLEDHAYDAVGHVLTSLPARHEVQVSRVHVPESRYGFLDDPEPADRSAYVVRDDAW